MISRIRTLMMFAGWLICGPTAVAQTTGNESPCDLSVRVPQGHLFSYRQYGDRCEGVYVQPVAGSTITIASFTKSFASFDPNSGAPLEMTWVTPGTAAVHLRGQSIKRRMYYRMDSLRPASSTTFRWPTNVLAGLAISRSDIGILAWTWHPVGGVPRAVYLPLRIRQGKDPDESSSYQLVLVPGREMKELYLTLARLDKDGKPSALVRDGEKLGYGYYPAERSIVVTIPTLPERGIYRLEVGSVLSGGGSSTTELWFFNSGV